MPIDYRIDRRKKTILVSPRGLLTHGEMVAYQKEVWSRLDVGGFDELIDMSFVDRLELRSPEQIFELAALSAGMDREKPPSRLAIVAPDRLHAALGRLYRASRGEHPSNRKEIEVFPSLREAQEWLRSGRRARAGRMRPRKRP